MNSNSLKILGVVSLIILSFGLLTIWATLERNKCLKSSKIHQEELTSYKASQEELEQKIVFLEKEIDSLKTIIGQN